MSFISRGHLLELFFFFNSLCSQQSMDFLSMLASNFALALKWIHVLANSSWGNLMFKSCFVRNWTAVVATWIWNTFKCCHDIWLFLFCSCATDCHKWVRRILGFDSSLKKSTCNKQNKNTHLNFILPISLHTQNHYTPKSSNIMGLNLHSLDAVLRGTLVLSDPPKNTSVRVDPTGPVLDGSSVTLTCTSIGNPAVLNFTWFRVAARQIKVVGSKPDFTFNVTKLSEDQYYCEALNVHGAEYSEPASISVTCEIYLFTYNCKLYFSPRPLIEHAQMH